MTELYTIGYEGLTAEKWLRKLKTREIDLVVDVREKPLSRKKGFSKTTMATLLEENGIEYIHLRELGSPENIRLELHETGDYKTFFTRYENYLSEQQDLLEHVLNLAKRRKTCLVCFESNASKCHRSVITEVIRANNPEEVRVWHL